MRVTLTGWNGLELSTPQEFDDGEAIIFKEIEDGIGRFPVIGRTAGGEPILGKMTTSSGFKA